MYLTAKHDPCQNQGSNVMPSTAAQTAMTGSKRSTTPVYGDHFIGSVGALMGSGAMMMTMTKINDGARPPQVFVVV
jgi:hypothetical protein